MSGIELTEAQGNSLLDVLDAAVRAEDLNVLDAVVAFTARLQQAGITLAEKKKTEPNYDKLVLELNFGSQQEVEALIAVLRLGLKSIGLKSAMFIHAIIQQIRKNVTEKPVEPSTEPAPAGDTGVTQ